MGYSHIRNPPLLQLVGGERGRHDTQRLYHGTKAEPEEVKLLIDLGCSVGEEEVDAASREADSQTRLPRRSQLTQLTSQCIAVSSST